MPAWLSGRALASHARGQKFESSSGHQYYQRFAVTSTVTVFRVCVVVSERSVSVKNSSFCSAFSIYGPWIKDYYKVRKEPGQF